MMNDVGYQLNSDEQAIKRERRYLVRTSLFVLVLALLLATGVYRYYFNMVRVEIWEVKPNKSLARKWVFVGEKAENVASTWKLTHRHTKVPGAAFVNHYEIHVYSAGQELWSRLFYLPSGSTADVIWNGFGTYHEGATLVSESRDYYQKLLLSNSG